MRVAGTTSTGSKRPGVLFGPALGDGPRAMTRSRGARFWDERGREYLDFVMALGAVSLGYADPAVTRAATDAIERGGVGSLAPVDEAALAETLGPFIPWAFSVRFLKTGAEAVAAAVRLARVATNRDRLLGTGYHGWLDVASTDLGVPRPVRDLYRAIPFDDVEAARDAFEEVGHDLAAVIVEPVVDRAPSREWLDALRDGTERLGAALIFDEIKTGFRLALGGAAERYGVVPDLAVYGKAMANGFPLAAVAGSEPFMGGIDRTWISSTLATEFVALAAARATLERIRSADFPGHAARVGGRLHDGLQALAAQYPGVVKAAGIPEMCHLAFVHEQAGFRCAVACAERGVMFKRNGYNFVSLAHTESDVDQCLAVVAEALAVI